MSVLEAKFGDLGFLLRFLHLYGTSSRAVALTMKLFCRALLGEQFSTSPYLVPCNIQTRCFSLGHSAWEVFLSMPIVLRVHRSILLSGRKPACLKAK